MKANFRLKKQTVFYLICLLIIGAVSAFDTYVSIKFPGFILDNEQNPVAKIIIQNFGLYNFILVKCFCTFFVLMACWGLTRTKYKVTIVFVTIFQVMLFLYLVFYSSKTSIEKDNLLYYLMNDKSSIEERELEIFLRRNNKQ